MNSPRLSIWTVQEGGTDVSFVFQSFLTPDGVCDGSLGGAIVGVPAVETVTGLVGPYSIVNAGTPIVGSAASVPAVSPLGLTVLAAFILGAAVWVMRRGGLRQNNHPAA